MLFPAPLLAARFVKREKRFFIHATSEAGQPLVAHTNNTGRMTGLLHPGARIWLSPASNPARKLKYSLEIVETSTGVPVGVNTALANVVVAEAIQAELIPALKGQAEIRREIRYGSRGSRIDLLLTGAASRTWIEVKNVSLVDDQHGRFPDAPTTRGRKHLLELQDVVRSGERAALVYCSQRPDTMTIGPADDIDPEYGALLREVAATGVELYGLGCQVTPRGIVADRLLQVDL